MKSVLMVGPARGHNIMRYLDVFTREQKDYQLTFCNYHPDYDFSSKNYPDINWVNVLNVPKFLWHLWKGYDVIWIHMYVPIPLILFTLFFRNRKSIVNYNIWGEPIPRKALLNNWRGYIYRYIMRTADHVMCPWYATYNIINDGITGVNAYVHPMGMNGEFFDLKSPQEYTKETLDFCARLPKDKVKIYFPKSFSSASDHHMVIEAARRLKEKGITNFIIYFWQGNIVAEKLESHYQELITKNNLDDQIEISHHSFLPTVDIQYIWRQMDVGLQIAIYDLLSTTILEPMYLKKEFIATNIAPYQIIEEKYDVDLDLMDLDVEHLVKRMEDVITGKKTQEEIMERRSYVAEKYFNTYHNVPSIVEYLTGGENVAPIAGHSDPGSSPE